MNSLTSEGVHAARLGFAPVLMLGTLLGLQACRETTTQPVLYRIDVPSQNQLDVEIELTQRIGLGLAGEFNIDIAGTRYAVIRLEPETSSHGFRLGLQMDLGLFIPDTLGSFRKVRSLPTGQAFASWIQSEMVDLRIPEANIPELSWNFYFGTGGRVAFGAAATITAINGNFPSISLDYAFRDTQGRLILGVQFYGPGRNSQGHSVPGGIFIGTDLTDLIPAEALAYLPSAGNQSAAATELGQAVQGLSQIRMASASLSAIRTTGNAHHVDGESRYREVSLAGRDANRYQRSPRALRRVIYQMLEKSREAGR